MPELVQKYYHVTGEQSNDWPEDIYGNIIEDGGKTSKVSILAPPGTVVEFQADSLNAKKILIGASGIYDFENESIHINSIAFPQAADTTDIITKLKAYIDKAYSEIPVPPGEKTDAWYKEFCDKIQTLLSPGTCPDEGYEGNMTLGAMTAEYLSVISDQVRGNTSLHDIIVNYIKD